MLSALDSDWFKWKLFLMRSPSFLELAWFSTSLFGVDLSNLKVWLKVNTMTKLLIRSLKAIAIQQLRDNGLWRIIIDDALSSFCAHDFFVSGR